MLLRSAYCRVANCLSTHHTCAARRGHACAGLWSRICGVCKCSISVGHEGHTSIGVWFGNACKKPNPLSGELFANTNVHSRCEQLVQVAAQELPRLASGQENIICLDVTGRTATSSRGHAPRLTHTHKMLFPCKRRVHDLSATHQQSRSPAMLSRGNRICICQVSNIKYYCHACGGVRAASAQRIQAPEQPDQHGSEQPNGDAYD